MSVEHRGFVVAACPGVGKTTFCTNSSMSCIDPDDVMKASGLDEVRRSLSVENKTAEWDSFNRDLANALEDASFGDEKVCFVWDYFMASRIARATGRVMVQWSRSIGADLSGERAIASRMCNKTAEKDRSKFIHTLKGSWDELETFLNILGGEKPRLVIAADSGTGKTTAVSELREAGYSSLDPDSVFSKSEARRGGLPGIEQTKRISSVAHAFDIVFVWQLSMAVGVFGCPILHWTRGGAKHPDRTASEQGLNDSLSTETFVSHFDGDANGLVRFVSDLI